MSPETAPADVDQLPPTQYLILEVLAARHRTGEMLWTFPSRLRPSLRVLEAAGLVGWQSGVEPNTVQAWLTDPGREAALLGGYTTPNGAAPAKLAAVWALYAECVDGPPVNGDWLVHRLGEILQGDPGVA